METEIAIVGAGLSGLALADSLVSQGKDVLVLEARDRAGGRVLSLGGYDLGPGWIWPHNRRMLSLTDRLGLSVFPQYASGRLVFEDAHGATRRDLDFATMGGSLRVAGGLAKVTDGLASALPSDVLHLSHRVAEIVMDGGEVLVFGVSADGPFSVRAKQVVLALPPRVVSTTIAFKPSIDGSALARVPTWMAGQAKIVAVYEQPFWRMAGLSGDGVSHRGPLAEIHDASPADLSEGALFGFLAPRPEGLDADELKRAALAQLDRFFGPKTLNPRAVHVQDWALEPETAVAADKGAPGEHPSYSPIAPLSGDWIRRLHFSGTETAPREGGFLEGALEAAEATAARIRASKDGLAA